MKRYLEFVGNDTSRGVENSSKFWEAWVEAETRMLSKKLRLPHRCDSSNNNDALEDFRMHI